MIGHGAELLRAFAAARSPRVTVIVRKAFGGAFITMNSKDLGADASFCWPQAEIGIMSAESAVEIIHARRLRAARSADLRARLARRYARDSLSLDAALRCGAIDAVIYPAETRRRVAAALRLGSTRSTGWGTPMIARAPAEEVERVAVAAAVRTPRRASAIGNNHTLSTAPEGTQL